MHFPHAPRIAVGSRNPVKVGAVTQVVRQWQAAARIEGVAVASGVPDQPRGDDETRRGAATRARAARAALDADIGIGIEGGVVDDDGVTMHTCAWAAVALRDGREFIGGSLAMPLPPAVAELVRRGVELGHAMDIITGGRDTKHGAGAVGILTNGLIDRQRAYEILVTYALSPLIASDYWDGVDVATATASGA
ncbi:MAG TPA: inosine/xanthosine triphosphatase [Gemmatimonadaceae bacterium]|jgi:inosine/xanthosine triphosphatase|nr:inosine/xanthosine triphosphatase [Gemmatimonadaceae bacterium]